MSKGILKLGLFALNVSMHGKRWEARCDCESMFVSHRFYKGNPIVHGLTHFVLSHHLTLIVAWLIASFLLDL